MKETDFEDEKPDYELMLQNTLLKSQRFDPLKVSFVAEDKFLDLVIAQESSESDKCSLGDSSPVRSTAMPSLSTTLFKNR